VRVSLGWSLRDTTQPETGGDRLVNKKTECWRTPLPRALNTDSQACQLRSVPEKPSRRETGMDANGTLRRDPDEAM
jgi:hypothetical protein